MRMISWVVLAAACDQTALPGTGSMGSAQRTYCGAPSTEAVMVAATSEYVWLVRGDGSFHSVASFSEGGETQTTISATSLGVEHGTASGSWLALFDRQGN